MTEFEHLHVSYDEGVALVTLNHPPANAINQGMIHELDSLFDYLLQDENVKVVLIHGEGNFFAAGADIKEFTHATGESFQQMSRFGQKVFNKIEAFSKPVICAIHGAALGGGLELAMACHIRIVSNDAKLGLPELQLGLIPGFGGTQRLPRYVGKTKATEMILTSKPITGEEAMSCGLATYSVPKEDLLREAMSIATKICEKGRTSIKFALELISMFDQVDFETACKQEAKRFGEVSNTKDAKEGIQAFIEKRKPKFRDS
ncbi:enoyl-CoA hydratase [Evansella sp. AB-P1]|uniref:enoyl-CoA hydratase n=1 Tax=Evansella sp. AB-P1 TaxID=3037653 RepID=UPI00241DD906|nr:enoyl-CoA hydratase [Evansella sp. AB-P1]MDG5786930.1 enoyl-CoA hydratase [Evansella sp. AB-P1]